MQRKGFDLEDLESLAKGDVDDLTEIDEVGVSNPSINCITQKAESLLQYFSIQYTDDDIPELRNLIPNNRVLFDANLVSFKEIITKARKRLPKKLISETNHLQPVIMELINDAIKLWKVIDGGDKFSKVTVVKGTKFPISFNTPKVPLKNALFGGTRIIH